ncbi:hypothetical protein [Aeromicrobium duanguangcaii]|uniref:hypothetical protein n=1 Tax=Aeromicrobium duanguangcaii TaxID=2968086 RepID=UPI002016B537|nr:hypothetical protein [Aeromicrobium duanguangcaii]MCL3836890.1 hypothetical protein [Aeromicrobium duanguangcaii]
MPQQASPSDTDFDWPVLLREALQSGEPICAGLASNADQAEFDRWSSEVEIRALEDPHGLVRLPGSAIRAALLDATVEHDPDGLLLEGVCITDGLDLDFASLRSPLVIRSSKIEGRFGLKSTKASHIGLRNVEVQSVDARHAQIEEELSMSDCRVNSWANFQCAEIGLMDLSQSSFGAERVSDVVLELNLAVVRSDLVAKEIRVNGSIGGVGIDVRGSLLLNGSELQPFKGRRLDRDDIASCYEIVLDNAEVGGVLGMMSLNCRGSVLARGSSVGGQLRGTGATMKDLTLDGSAISDSAHLEGITAQCFSFAAGSTSHVDLSGAKLLGNRRDTRVVSLDNTRITGDLSVGHDGNRPFWMASGWIMLWGASIGGDVRSPSGPENADASRVAGIDFSRAVVNGNVRLEGSVQTVVASNATFGSGFDLGIKNECGSAGNGVALTADGATFKQLKVGDRTKVRGTIDLSAAHVENLVLEGKPPSFSPTMTWNLGNIYGEHVSARGLSHWLSDESEDSYHAQPWFRVAEVFEAAGEEVEARKVRIAATDLSMKRRSLATRYFWRPITKATIGHGYHSSRALWGMLTCWFLTLAIVWSSRSSFSPRDPEVAAAGDYPGFWPWLYATDIVVSPLGTGQADAWWINSAEITGILIVIKLVSWAFFGLFISGVTGLVSRK